VISHQERLRGLVEAGIALTSELSLEAVLKRIVEAAAQLTGARYAALGVIDRAGKGLERFVTTGIEEERIAEIGDFPVGRGILGILIREAKPLRLHDLTEDPRSVGFPPGHPPMKSFVGVPIMLRGVAYGNLYLTEKAGGEDFTDDDEEALQLLAAQAAVAIENARLYESATRWLRQLESMTEVGNALASETELARLLDLIARRLRELLGARVVYIAIPDGTGELRVEAAADHQTFDALIGMVIPRTSKTARILDRRRTERVDSFIDDPEIDREFVRRFAETTGLPLPSTGLYVPLVVRERAIGVVVAHDKPGPGGDARDMRFTDEDIRLAETFASRAAVAVDLSERIRRDALRRIVEAQELERKRLARELHDETGQALTSILLGLRTVESADTDADRVAATTALREIAVATLQDVRRLAVELRPKALDDFGLVAAVERLTDGFRDQTGLTVQLEASIAERLPPEVELVLYRIVQESLTNVVKHARARHISIILARKPSSVIAVIEDDGRGFADDDREGGSLGLLGLRERLALVGGKLTVESAPGSGATIVAEVPLP
jgi:signal transduction histidine kinase